MRQKTSTDWQREAIEQAFDKFPNANFTEEIIQAFMEIPRHAFIRRFSDENGNWIPVNHFQLDELLPVIYADSPLLLYQDAHFTSTISQPTFVLLMLAMLDLKEGQKVFELGTGSGWNAGMMGHIVGPKGLVVTMEIIPEMAEYARLCLHPFHLQQVKVIEGDANLGAPVDGPYDRGVFTAGAYDLPPVYFHQIKEGGILLFVLKTLFRGDLLLLLKKVGNHFECLESLRCSFVPVTGKAPHHARALDEVVGLENHIKIYLKEDFPEEPNTRNKFIGENCLYLAE